MGQMFYYYPLRWNIVHVINLDLRLKFIVYQHFRSVVMFTECSHNFFHRLKKLNDIGMKVTKIILGAFIAASAFISACNDDDEKKPVQEPDRTFAQNAAYGNLAEIQLGGLAVSKATDTDVRAFAQMMINDHQTSLNELKSISDERDLKLPDEIDQQHQVLRDRLQSLTGYSFDTAYMHNQVKDHQATSALFQSESALGKEDRFKSYANKYLPKITEHWGKANTISDKLDAQVKDGE